MVRNQFYQKDFSIIIKPASSIKNLNIAELAAPIPHNTPQQFQVSYDSLGEPSCAQITQTYKSKTKIIKAIGSDSLTCSMYFPRVTFEPYSANGSLWTFTSSFKNIGLLTVEVLLRNSLESLTLSTNINVLASLIDCQNPVLNIDNRSPLFYAPSIHKRNELFRLTTNTEIKCNASLDNKKEWLVYSIDDKTGDILNRYRLFFFFIGIFVLKLFFIFSDKFVPKKIKKKKQKMKKGYF